MEAELDYDPNHPAELYAEALGDGEGISVNQVETLVALLPHDLQVPTRPETKGHVGKMWSTGACVRNGKIGLRRSTRTFPKSTRMLVKFVKDLKPGFHFNGIEISFHVKVKGHCDRERVGRELVVPLSEFEGGGIRNENNTGL